MSSMSLSFEEKLFYGLQDQKKRSEGAMRWRFYGTMKTQIDSSGEEAEQGNDGDQGQPAEFILVVHSKEETSVLPMMSLYSWIDGSPHCSLWSHGLSQDDMKKHWKDAGLSDNMDPQEFASMYISALSDCLKPMTSYPTSARRYRAWKCSVSTSSSSSISSEREQSLAFPLTYQIDTVVGNIQKPSILHLGLESSSLPKSVFHNVRELGFRTAGLSPQRSVPQTTTQSPQKIRTQAYAEGELSTEVTTTVAGGSKSGSGSTQTKGGPRKKQRHGGGGVGFSRR